MRTYLVSFFAAICFLVITSCSNSPEPNDASVNVQITKQTLADQLGDKNGTASTDELNYVDEYFSNHNKMWVITNCMNTEGSTITSNEVKSKFFVQSSGYPSQEILRDENQGLSIRAPWIGVAVLEKNNDLFITRTFRSPGPDFASVAWEEIRIIK